MLQSFFLNSAPMAYKEDLLITALNSIAKCSEF